MMKERYDGTNGRTQEEKKESSPPPKATTIERFSASFKPSRPYQEVGGVPKS